MLDFLASLVVDVIFIGIFYLPGWLVLRIVTLGKSPPPKSEPHNKEFVATCGLATLIAMAGFIYS